MDETIYRIDHMIIIDSKTNFSFLKKLKEAWDPGSYLSCLQVHGGFKVGRP